MSANIFKEQEEETKIFWQAIANRTNCLIKLSFAIYAENNRVLDWINLNNTQPLPPHEVFSFLKKENAWFKNKTVKKAVLWKFAEGQTYNIAIIDDLRETKRFIEKDHFLLWETSEGKYQAAFLIDQYLNAEDIKKVQKSLIQVYGGDKSSLGACHNLKMPGFLNTKYIHNPPLIKLLYIGENILSSEQLLRYYKYNIEQKERKPKNDTNLPRLLAYRKLKKTWQDFHKGDESETDFSYALYLMHFNLSDDEIKQILLNESYDIQNRKRGHLEDYLNRTVSKARACFKPFKEQD